MKTAHHTRQNKRFENQLNHLQGAIGIGHWPTTELSIEQIRAYDQHGRKLQSGAVIKATRRGFKALQSLLLDSIVKMIKRYKKRKNLGVFLKLNEHILKDIGLSRADAFEVAKGRISMDEINAQRQAIVEAKIKARRGQLKSVKPVHAPQVEKLKTFAANDPRYASKCA